MQHWVVFSLLALLLWGLWGFFSKLSTWYLDPKSATIMQGIAALAVTLAVIALLGARPQVHPLGLTTAFIAGLALWSGMVAFIYALGSGGKAAVVVPMTALYPLVTIILSLGVLKEKVDAVHALGILLALIAVFLLSK